MTYKSQQMKFQDISIGGEWFYRCRDKGTRLSNNLVKVTSRWKIWKSFYWILSLHLNLPPKMWESLEMSTPHKLRVCSGTTPVMHNWWSNKRIHFSSRCFVEETGSEIFEESERDAQIFPLMVAGHSRGNMEEEIQVHWSPTFPRTVLRKRISVLTVFQKSARIPAETDYSLECASAPLWQSLCLPAAYSFHSLECRDDELIIFTLF